MPVSINNYITADCIDGKDANIYLFDNVFVLGILQRQLFW